MKTLRWFILPLMGVLLVLLVSLWLFSGSEGSLATALRATPLLLPNAQQLSWQDVTGNVRYGGHLGTLRWQREGLQVDLQDITLRWQPAQLLHGKLLLDELTIGALHIEDQTPPNDAAPTPPIDLRLPIQINANVKIGTLQWTGSTTQHVEQIAFNYIFDSYKHILNKGESLFLSNKYTFSGTLQASDRLALALQANGQVTAPVPGRAPLSLAANTTLTGELASSDAELTLQADLTPAAKGNAMQATLTAQLAPWQAQPIRHAQASWQALDLATLWSQAPHTLLSGQASVTPQGAGWQATTQLRNARSGPWNQQRLPIQTLQAELGTANGRWLLHKLQVQGAGGQITAEGQLSTPDTWQMRAQLQNIDPATIDTRWPNAALHGALSARQALNAAGVAQPLVFALDLQNKAASTPVPTVHDGNDALASLRLQQVVAQGQWSRPTLDLSKLQIDAEDAQLSGPLRIDITSRAMQGQLDLHLPGLNAAWQGQISPQDGQGTLSVQLVNATQTSRWLSRWPQLAQALRGRLSGDAALKVQWHGGWQNQLQAMQLQGQLRAGQLGWRAVPATANSASNDTIALRDVQLDVAGSPAALTFGSNGQLAMQSQRMRWQVRAVGKRLISGDWQIRIDDAQLALPQQDKPQAEQVKQPWQDTWRLTLDTPTNTPVLLHWQAGTGGGQWVLSPGSAQLQGPAAGNASLRWQVMQWSPTAWQSEGRVAGLPLIWLDTVVRRSLSELGLRSDMLLSGQWVANKTQTLNASLTLERSSGDLFLQSDEGSQSAIAADMRETWLQVNLDDTNLSASLRWDSLRAGKALVAFSTQVQSATGDWSWRDDTPVAGSVQLQLPPMNVWSVLAPPGWRLRGTVNTHIDLTGSLRQPIWSGTLQARDLALRSVVDGIDFRQGRLDATLHDQQLDVQVFTLRGLSSKDSDGGQLTLSGNVLWRPEASTQSFYQNIQITLQAELQKLRLSTRPDRRLIASGKLNAELKNGTMNLRGTLRADQALFTLPDDSTPTLGDDVVVRQTTTVAVAVPPRAAWTTPKGITIDINLNPGDNFQVRGRGMNTRLTGTLHLTASPGQGPRLVGNLQSVKGSYRAYGQNLTIERGVIGFTGAVDNPTLDILAIRPKLTQRVGVQITGTVLSPIIALYAEPDLPDAEKLAWLVLGRAASEGSAEVALLQQAAMSLLGGNGKGVSESLGEALGLDELSFRGSTEAGDNTGTATGASVTLGKRLTGDFYVTYERSLGSAVGVFSIFYDLSKHLTLRTQTGEQSTLDLIYTLRYD